MADAHSAKEFFLGAAAESDDKSFRAPAREHTLVQPLIDADAAFRAMESAIFKAKTSVFFALWFFDPKVELLGVRKPPKLRTWADLLRTAAENGAKVRVILSDQDPVLTINYHEAAWAAHRQLTEAARRIPAKRRDRFQLIVSSHEATFNAPEESTDDSADKANKLTRDALQAIMTSLKGRPSQFADTPGLWSLIEKNAKTGKFERRKDASPTIYFGSHHQKLLIVDGSVAFLGGLDVVKGRIDSQAHKGRAWHDSMCRVEGAPVGDLLRNFVARWNEEEPRFVAFVKAANAPSKRFKIEPLPSAALKLTSDAGAQGESVAQIHRTVSRQHAKNALPETVRGDIAEAYEKAINAAREFVYIENQYFRSLPLQDVLTSLLDRVPALQLIIVVPVAPEEVNVSGGADRLTEHGLFLQHRAFKQLQTAFKRNQDRGGKGRLGIYSMIAQRPAAKKKSGVMSKTNVANSHQIYVHNKCLIVDDVYAHVGSANTNPRSFELDTEVGIGWFDPTSVRELRQQLWNELLGRPNLRAWKVSDYVTEWNRIAEYNLKLTKSRDMPKRKGFVVPHDIEAFPGKDNTFMFRVLGLPNPTRFTELFDRSPGLENQLA